MSYLNIVDNTSKLIIIKKNENIITNKAIKKKLICIMVDTGLMRKNEFNPPIDEYEEIYNEVNENKLKKDLYFSWNSI